MFFEEARELLQALEAGLVDLEAKCDDRAHLDRTFRAAHTLKGAAGMVGLRSIADFTHGVEAVLDHIRSGRLAVRPEVITALLSARDHLESAVEGAVGGTTVDPPTELAAFLAALAANPEAGASQAVKSETVPTAEVAVPASAPADSSSEASNPAADATPADESERYRIRIEPGPDQFRQGIHPEGFLDELRELGTLEVEADASRVPDLDAIDPDTCYLAWTVHLTTTAPRKRIEEVFFLLGDSGRFTIERVGELSGDQASASAEIPEGASQAGSAPAPVAAPAPPAPAAESKPKVMKPTAKLRVEAEQLDELLGLAGELAILTDSLQGLREVPESTPWAGTLEALERLGRRLRDTTLELRMVPIEELFNRFPRLVRDLAERIGKPIQLRIEGEDTRLDRTIIERLSEPMVHMIRNAIDHGLEMPGDRVKAGKPATGRLTIGAGYEGDRVAIRIRDDGKGLDRARIAKKGIRLGMLPPEVAADDPRVGNLIFEAGFSTKEAAGELSGRGVGLDVVRDTIRSLRGSVTVRSVEGQGTTFLIHLPLTLALIDGLLVEVGGGRYVVPMTQVDECVALSAADASWSLHRRAVVVRGDLVPLVPLRRTFGLPLMELPRQELLLTQHGEQRVGVVVDRLLGRVQTVIQPLDESMADVRQFSGATILGDGSICLILDLASVVAQARRDAPAPSLAI
jgi:two-component system chemotaxis sensor kinase CheA